MKNVFYPKQLNRIKIKEHENQCFFAMPFSEQYTNLYDTLSLYMEKEGYKCIRVDNNLSASVPIINLILSELAASRYVIVDISESNANVFYELGITHTIKDWENVFILKEDSVTTPFDIQHLQYISYNKNNLKNLANEIIKRLNANRYKNTFKLVLSEKQLLRYDDINEFGDFFINLFSEEHICIFTELLTNEIIPVSLDCSMLNAIWEYDRILRKQISEDKNDIYISIMFKLFFEVLLRCYRIDEVELFIRDFLQSKNYGDLYANSLLPYQTDLAIKFAENSRLLEITLKWIIEYFQRSKSTRVDLNRYKLEAFLLKSDSDRVNEYIINALISDNDYVREHMADIVGEKKLYIAEENLITQLKRETNFFTVSSLVEALGKIKSQKAAVSIREWLKNNAETVINNKDFFVLKHIRNALVKISAVDDLEQFDKKFFEILIKNNAI